VKELHDHPPGDQTEKAISRQQLLAYAKDLLALYENERDRCEALELANTQLLEEMAARRKLEGDLLRSEEKYRTLFENAHDAIFIVTREGLLVDANDAFLRMFGFDREEFLDTNVLGIHVDPGRRTALQDLIERDGSVRDFQIQLRRKDGTVMKCVLNATVRTDKDGAVLGYQGIVRDITEQMRSQEVIHQAKKMEALANMAASLAHEIRNPLAISSSAAQLLMDDRLPRHLRQESAAKIVSGINRTSLIVENLLDFARPMDECEMNRVDLAPLVRSTLKTAAGTAFKGEIKLVLQLCKEPLPVMCNAQSLQRALLNLFSRALAATSPGGSFHVEVAKRDGEAMVTVNTSDSRIPEDVIDKAFDPFFDAFSGARGTNLGLWVAHSVINQHGGAIFVEGSDGKGPKFRVHLPLSQGS